MRNVIYIYFLLFNALLFADDMSKTLYSTRQVGMGNLSLVVVDTTSEWLNNPAKSFLYNGSLISMSANFYNFTHSTGIKEVILLDMYSYKSQNSINNINRTFPLMALFTYGKLQIGGIYYHNYYSKKSISSIFYNDWYSSGSVVMPYSYYSEFIENENTNAYLAKISLSYNMDILSLGVSGTMEKEKSKSDNNISNGYYMTNKYNKEIKLGAVARLTNATQLSGTFGLNYNDNEETNNLASFNQKNELTSQSYELEVRQQIGNNILVGMRFKYVNASTKEKWNYLNQYNISTTKSIACIGIGFKPSEESIISLEYETGSVMEKGKDCETYFINFLTLESNSSTNTIRAGAELSAFSFLKIRTGVEAIWNGMNENYFQTNRSLYSIEYYGKTDLEYSGNFGATFSISMIDIDYALSIKPEIMVLPNSYPICYCESMRCIAPLYYQNKILFNHQITARFKL